jgi:hypothetical protein
MRFIPAPATGHWNTKKDHRQNDELARQGDVYTTPHVPGKTQGCPDSDDKTAQQEGGQAPNIPAIQSAS